MRSVNCSNLGRGCGNRLPLVWNARVDARDVVVLAETTVGSDKYPVSPVYFFFSFLSPTTLEP